MLKIPCRNPANTYSQISCAFLLFLRSPLLDRWTDTQFCTPCHKITPTTGGQLCSRTTTSVIANKTPTSTVKPSVEELNNYRKGCTQLTPNVPTSYDYVPHLSAGIVFVTLFSLSMAGHIIQGIRKRQWTSYVCATGAPSKSPAPSPTTVPKCNGNRQPAHQNRSPADH